MDAGKDNRDNDQKKARWTRLPQDLTLLVLAPVIVVVLTPIILWLLSQVRRYLDTQP